MDISSLYLKRTIANMFALTVSTKVLCSSNSCLKWAKSSFMSTSAIRFGLHKPRLFLIKAEVAHELLWGLGSAAAFVVSNLLVVLWALVGWA
jgi:hypothetical protein